MSNPDFWEKRLQSWNPRAPSKKIASALFEGGATAKRQSHAGPRHFRGVELWNWLTPVAACCLTVIVLCSNSTRRVSQYDSRDNGTYFATLMLDAASSNAASQTFALSKGDENIEWNVWPHATMRTTNLEIASASSYTNGARGQSRSATNGIYP